MGDARWYLFVDVTANKSYVPLGFGADQRPTRSARVVVVRMARLLFHGPVIMTNNAGALDPAFLHQSHSHPYTCFILKHSKEPLGNYVPTQFIAIILIIVNTLPLSFSFFILFHLFSSSLSSYYIANHISVQYIDEDGHSNCISKNTVPTHRVLDSHTGYTKTCHQASACG